MVSDASFDRRRLGERRAVPRGGRRATDPDVIERTKRAQREQQVVKYLRKQDEPEMTRRSAEGESN